MRRWPFYASLGAATVALAAVTTREILRASGGPAVPLDDTYIHFQYARSIAELHPFRYTAGAAPTPGATSLLWPLLLSLFYALGLRDEQLIWAAWALGWLAMPLLAVETERLAAGLVKPRVAMAAGAMVVAFGGFAWFCASGMEVVPFAWLLTRTIRRSVEWFEGRTQATKTHAPSVAELLALAAVTCLMRPEGVIGAGVVAVTLLLGSRGRSRWLALGALAAPLLPLVVCRLATGQAVTSTAIAKWLPLNPYYRGATLVSAVTGNVGIFFGTLLDGRLWTSVFLPSGGRAVAVAALGAVPLAGLRRHRWPRALAVLVLALGALVPATYETFLVNRVRYIWPFTAGWFVALACLADTLGFLVDRALSQLRSRKARTSSAGNRADPGDDATKDDGAQSPEPERGPVRRILDPSTLIAGSAVLMFAAELGPSIDDVASAAHAVTAQQVSLARWARGALGPGARIGVNDTGAMAYFSGHETFDIVGLTTAGEARFWTAGAGSRFEHYERLAPSRLPTHFVVYPEWFGLEVLLGEELAARTVHHTILGGATMAAFRSRYDLLHSGDAPLDAPVDSSRLLDVLDVADLDDEAAHGFALFDASSTANTVVAGADRADGARTFRRRDRFTLGLAPGGTLVMRLGARTTTRVRVFVDERPIAAPELAGSDWQEIRVRVPDAVSDGAHDVQVIATSDVFSSLHYWSYR